MTASFRCCGRSQSHNGSLVKGNCPQIRTCAGSDLVIGCEEHAQPGRQDRQGRQTDRPIDKTEPAAQATLHRHERGQLAKLAQNTINPHLGRRHHKLLCSRGSLLGQQQQQQLGHIERGMSRIFFGHFQLRLQLRFAYKLQRHEHDFLADFFACAWRAFVVAPPGSCPSPIPCSGLWRMPV